MESATRLGNMPERQNFLSPATLEFWISLESMKKKKINFKKEILNN
jgi:hypothetical protein